MFWIVQIFIELFSKKISWILFGGFIFPVILKQITANCILTLFVIIRAFTFFNENNLAVQRFITTFASSIKKQQ